MPWSRAQSERLQTFRPSCPPAPRRRCSRLSECPANLARADLLRSCAQSPHPPVSDSSVHLAAPELQEPVGGWPPYFSSAVPSRRPRKAPSRGGGSQRHGNIRQRIELLLHPRAREPKDGEIVTVWKPSPLPVNAVADQPPISVASRPRPTMVAASSGRPKIVPISLVSKLRSLPRLPSSHDGSHTVSWFLSNSGRPNVLNKLAAWRRRGQLARHLRTLLFLKLSSLMLTEGLTRSKLCWSATTRTRQSSSSSLAACLANRIRTNC